ncbi:efflux RND transporter periplasmic adaptor subunit [Pseudoalteromonas sp. PS5]|uniref:efflux RND transporter periplasmic adaptor subunit n=1 Tax=Pseudoalteromonas sp. PS5 TaxID=1437473 RepID=UPI000FFEC94D|nr:efflux RND transporter periplasmic adaptor subunit [Pseudoalteromonas sp. PS5]RXF05067.1 efflux RND transporter periplasmic adaptor subunit [Pseudoalteromonas sp. PS5]
MKENKNKSLYHQFRGRVSALILVLLVGVTACFALFGVTKVPANTHTSQAVFPLVSSVPIAVTDHQVSLSLSGILKPAEQTDVAFEVSGKVVWLHEAFVVGGIVKKGEVLARLDPFDYQTQLLNKQAELALAQSHLSEQLALAKVAKKEWENNPHVTELALREPQVSSARAHLKAAEAGLAQAQKNLARTKYYAPYDALVTRRDTGLGQVINIGQQLGIVVNLSYGELHVPIAQFDLPFLPPLPVSEVTITADDIQRVGTLTRHTGLLSERTRMAYFVIKVEDPYALHSTLPAIHFGQFLQAQVPGNILKNVLKIPQEWIKNEMLWLVSPTQQLVQFPVNVLRREHNSVLISAPPYTDHQLVTHLPDYPQADMQVRTNTVHTQLAVKGDE